MPPWDHIDASLEFPLVSGRRTFTDAVADPCGSCVTSPCCWLAPLRDVTVEDWRDLDYLRYVATFPGIELHVEHPRIWHIRYRVPCQHLDPDTFRCAIYDTGTRPDLCRAYDAVRCHYRDAFHGEGVEGYVRLDKARLEHLLAYIVLDERGAIVHMPEPKAMAGIIADAPSMPPWRVGPPPPAPPLDDRADYKMGEVGCESCGLRCCRFLTFPVTTPTTVGHFDVMRFLVRFPRVGVVAHLAHWVLLLDVPCAAIGDDGTTCMLEGDPRRARRCSHRGEADCARRTTDEPGDWDVVVTQPAEVDALVEALSFDTRGNLRALPSREWMARIIRHAGRT